MLKRRNINHIFSELQHKANFAESAIKHLKHLTFSYIKSKHTQKWVDQFQKIVKTRNKSFNRSLNTNLSNEWNKMTNQELWKHQFMMKAKNKKLKRKTRPNISSQEKYEFVENDYVRISAHKTKFHRFYSDKQVDEVFIVVNRYIIEGIKLYQIIDNDDNLIKSRMYEEQLVRANVSNKSYEIREIIKERIEKGKKNNLWSFSMDTKHQFGFTMHK